MFHTNSLSPHQLPLARELVGLLGQDNYRYVYTTQQTSERTALGWSVVAESWATHENGAAQGEGEDLDNCEVLMSSLREVSRFEERALKGLRSIYVSERWLKPIRLFEIGSFCIGLPGVFRMLVPGYFKMASRMTRLFQLDKGLTYLAVGVWAASDIVRVSQICGVRFLSPASWFRALRGMFCSPKLQFERVPGGRIRTEDGIALRNVRLWGYFVEPSQQSSTPRKTRKGRIKVLWVGRMITLKRIDALVNAVRIIADKRSVESIALTLVGSGSQEGRLRGLAKGLNVEFVPPVNVQQVRSFMRQNDVFVFPSNAYEGWGAVVSEAIEEGMQVFGSRESGAAATVLHEANQFRSGDSNGLAKMLEREMTDPMPRVESDDWSARRAAHALFSILQEGATDKRPGC